MLQLCSGLEAMNQRPIKPQDRQNSPSSKTFSSTLQGFSSSLIKRFTIIDNLLATKFPSIQTLVLRQKKTQGRTMEDWWRWGVNWGWTEWERGFAERRLRLNEKYGCDDIESISGEVQGKSVEEVKDYAKVELQRRSSKVLEKCSFKSLLFISWKPVPTIHFTRPGTCIKHPIHYYWFQYQSAQPKLI